MAAAAAGAQVLGGMAMHGEGDTLLIYAPVPLHRDVDGRLLLEDQACDGLRLWAENFGRVIAMLPLDPGPPPAAWVPLDRIGPNAARIEVVPLPQAWRPDRFLRALRPTRAVIRAAIARADYLSFAIGGLFGDWGAVACIEAGRMGRPHAVWTDRVESQVTRRAMHAGPARQRLRAALTHRPMAWLERRLIGRATVGLFHGRETHDAYAPFARAAEVVHDIHLARGDHIAPAALAAKQRAVRDGPLRLVYAGRAEPMKGPDDWLAVMAALDAAGVDFTADWHGAGSALERLRAEAARRGLAGRVRFPGFTTDRAAVLAHLRAAHLFVFCHKTPESPRVLIEALASGTPLAGYDGAFARDLIAGGGGGVLVPRDDARALAQALARLAGDRAALADLVGRAARDGAPFDADAVFRHRSDLIRRHLGPAAAAPAPS
jgi:glycosyltransferase involved in cell wall biosynthesis